MKIRELIDSINIFDVKVSFDDWKTMQLNGDIIYFTPVDGKERTKYERIYRKEKFVSTSACIHFPDLNVSDIIDIYKNCDGSGMYDFTCNLILEHCKNIVNMDEAFIVFIFLHEVGHWKQFNKLKCNVKLFEEMDMDLEKDNFNKMRELQEQRNERWKRGNTCIQTAKEKRLAEQYMREYRCIPKEKEADEFALTKIKDSLNLLYSKQ